MSEHLSNYQKRGVSQTKKDVHDALTNIDKGLFPGAFCKVIPDFAENDDSFCTLMHADGAGTKSSLAYLYYQETGDLSVFAGIAQDSIVMNIDDMICAGVTENIVLSSTIGRNANRIPGEIIKTIIDGNEKVIDFYNEHGISMSSAGGETADVGDLVRTIIVDTTAVARMPKSEIIDCANMKAGQVIVALSSEGQTTYEDEYNSGIGSNGLTSARHDIFSHEYAEKYPETYDPEIPKDLVYNGKFKVTDRVANIPINMGKAVLSPTRTYAPVLSAVLGEIKDKIGGIIHCSGGAQTKCLKFGRDLHFVKNTMMNVAPLFHYIQEAAGTSWKEMYSVFNMGQRMEFIVDEIAASAIIDVAKSFKMDAQIVGYIENSDIGNKLTINSEFGDFEYNENTFN